MHCPHIRHKLCVTGPRVCGSCVQNLCAAGPPPGPSAPNWRDKESAFWHTHHDHDGKPPAGVDRYFKNKGEKSKGVALADAEPSLPTVGVHTNR